MEEAQWFYAEGQKILGPFTADQMIDKFRDGDIHPATLVMSQGMSEWQLLSRTELYAQTADDSGGEQQESKRQENEKRESERRGSRRQESRSFISSAAERISEMTGEEGPISLGLKDIFSDVFKKHSKAESDRIFIAGTQYTTPDLMEISSGWPKPWLFSRVFLSFLAVYVLLFLCLIGFGNDSALPGLIVIGSFAVPFSLVIFFFETNVPRNISIYSVVEMFFIGGVSAIFLTLLLYSFVSINQVTFFSAIIIGLIEETGKVLIAAWFIRQMNTRYILNGLLIGAVIGAGFASFESAGYALSALLATHGNALFSVIDSRAWTSIGSHTVWTAIAAAALVIVKKEQPFQIHLFRQRQFLEFFAVSVLLHAFWDMPLLAGSFFKPLLLIAIGWLFILVLINSGLRQIGRIIRKQQGLR